jgi:hypothetical protein
MHVIFGEKTHGEIDLENQNIERRVVLKLILPICYPCVMYKHISYNLTVDWKGLRIDCSQVEGILFILLSVLILRWEVSQSVSNGIVFFMYC